MLEKVAQQFSHEFGVPVEYSIDGEPFPLNQFAAHELLMIAREGLYNAIRHARPSKIQLAVKFQEGRCIVKIEDQGCGFDVDAISRKVGDHYGLLGMKERVDRIDGRFTLHSAIGVGTEITIEVPRKAIQPAPASEVSL